ncbi:MAG: methyltransferase domain-containing protein [Bernardetiaceae bacterium]|jgi:2-polyprenyl-3-methyl-5-hydroxy-6-metoxy-1,4-benzoquinol methylase|nr:methyltransferase domain-containing protein [Bernardetiaceae bacterium]
MPDFSRRSTQPELMDDLGLASDALRQNLEELETINTRLGGYQTVFDALAWLYSQGVLDPHQPASLLDIGCGGGDTLRQLHRWAARRQRPLQLAGLDANTFMLDFARQKAAASPTLAFYQADVFGPELAQHRADVLLCSLFCHHFTTAQLAELLPKLLSQANKVLIINDLHRHWLAYYSIKALTWLFRGSYLVQHDAPLSVLRAFSRAELEQLMHQCGVSRYQLRWQWAFRWRLVILKNG